MLHELIGLENNRIMIENIDKKEKDQENEYVVSSNSDPFFNKSLFLNYAEITDSIVN